MEKLIIFLLLSAFAFAECADGPITQQCTCGDADYAVGWCCNDIYFDPFYSDTYANPCNQRFLYVDMHDLNCNDGRSISENTETAPWCSLRRATWGSTSRDNPIASEAAQAGDIVIIKEGVYDYENPNFSSRSPFYDPVNSGGPGNYITFKGIGTVELTTSPYSPQCTTDPPGAPIIGSGASSYIKWDNFLIRQDHIQYRCGNGIVNIWGDYTTISNSEIIGVPTYYEASDQHNAITSWSSYGSTSAEVEQIDGTIIENNKLHGFTCDGCSQRNHVALTMYFSGSATIRHNEFYDSGDGIYLKTTDEGSDLVEVHNNVFRDNLNTGIALMSDSNWQIFQNIFKDMGGGISVSPGCYQHSPAGGCSSGPFDMPYNYYVVNNVFDGLSWSAFNFGCNAEYCDYMYDNFFQNNIVANSNSAISSESYAGAQGHYPANFDFDNNLYYNYNTFLIANDGSDNYPFTLWNSETYGNQDQNSLTTDNPMFVDAANNDFRLQGGSPAETLGIDILDLDNDGSTTDTITAGAYITGDEIIGTIDFSSATAGCNPVHAADSSPCDGSISLAELMAHINAWRSGQYSIQSVMEAITIWKG